jgi:hypothetical protein
LGECAFAFLLLRETAALALGSCDVPASIGKLGLIVPVAMAMLVFVAGEYCPPTLTVSAQTAGAA